MPNRRNPLFRLLGYSFIIVLFTLLLAYLFNPFERPQNNGSQKYNVILITMDSVRADHLGVYGYEKNISSNLDSLAEEGILFEQAISQGEWTIPSIYSLMTGKYPSYLLSRQLLNEPLGESEETLAEILSNKGFLTQAFTGFFMLSPKINLGKGFDNYSFLNGYDDVEMNEIVSDWLDANSNEQFFLYIHYEGAHAPYLSHEEFLDSDCLGNSSEYDISENSKMINFRMINFTEGDIDKIICLYDNKINQTDFLIGSLVEKLKQLDLYDRTILVITADHGEHLFDRVPWFGHGVSLYNDLIRVPLMIYIPGFDDGLRITQKVQLIDIFPTILGMLDIPHESSISGRNILPLIENGNWTDRILLSGYWSEYYLEKLKKFPSERIFVSDGDRALELDDYICSNPNLTTCISFFEEYHNYTVDMSGYPYQIDLYNNIVPQIFRVFNCSGDYFYVWIYSLQGRSLSDYKNYLDSARCYITNQSGRYIIGNFSIDYPTGQEIPLPTHLFSIFFDEWKYIFSANGTHELYNLSDDPQEEKNVISEYPEIVEEIDEYIEESTLFNQTKNANETETTNEIIQKLFELGYLRY